MADMNEYPNPATIAAELMTDMGLSSGEGGEIVDTSSKEETSDPNPASLPENAADGPAPGTAAFDAMPKAWRKEMEAHWSKLDPEVRKYVHTREADVSRGIQMYQQGHSSWNKLLEPYQRIFEAYPQVDPIALMQGVMNQHLQMAQGRPEQRMEILRAMAKAYGVELPGGETAPQGNQELLELRERLANMERMWQSAQNALQADVYQKNISTVEAFSSDPANKYWGDVVEDVLHLLKKGAASSLEEAYETACYRNPKVRAEIVKEQMAAAQPSLPRNVAKFPNLSSDTNVAPRTKAKSMDETIDEIVAKHASSL